MQSTNKLKQSYDRIIARNIDLTKQVADLFKRIKDLEPHDRCGSQMSEASPSIRKKESAKVQEPPS